MDMVIRYSCNVTRSCMLLRGMFVPSLAKFFPGSCTFRMPPTYYYLLKPKKASSALFPSACQILMTS